MPKGLATHRWKILSIGAALGFGLIAVQLLLAMGAVGPGPGPMGRDPGEESGLAAVERIVRERFPVQVSTPEGPPRIATGQYDGLGRPISVSCVSCHTSLAANISRRSSIEPPMEFHGGLTFDHGTLACVSCHNSVDYNTLRLADSTSLPYSGVMSLCAQCHAPQARDWEHGAHGGMTGYWDLSRGGRVRKNCIDCHDPHSPAFPAMRPTFKPRDRGLHPPHGHPHHTDHHEEAGR
jgi:hypothetical protein